MTKEKRAFVQEYINKLSEELNLFYNTEPGASDSAENELFDLILEISNVFVEDLPQIERTIQLSGNTVVRDANSVLGILKLYLINTQGGEAPPRTAEMGNSPRDTANKKIFISHRSTDKEVADLLEIFLTKCGISTEHIFCTSLPGNDIKEKIPPEVKEALKNSVVNIAILSQAYYESAYCQNEAGIIWFSDVESVVFALPDVDERSMQGFLNDEYKIKRFDSRSDLFTALDIIRPYFPEISAVPTAKLNSNVDHLVKGYLAITDTGKVKNGFDHQSGKKYHEAQIVRVWPPSNPQYFELDHLLELDEDTSKDKSHWICDRYHKFVLHEKDRIRFRVDYTKFGDKIMHGDEPIYAFRNIIPESDLKVI